MHRFPPSLVTLNLGAARLGFALTLASQAVMGCAIESTGGYYEDGGASAGDSGYGGYGGQDGGQEPPSDDAPEDEQLDDPAECDAETDVVLYLSPDDSNSMSSPVQARAAIADGLNAFSYVPIRVWEFFNYYSFDYPTPATRGEVTVTTELLRTANDDDRVAFSLQIGVASETVVAEDRAPMNITLVLDESGSMGGAPMDMQREVCRAIAASLRPGDIVSAVGWDTENAIKLGGYSVAGPDDETLLGVCDGLASGGGTDLHGGLVAGYELALASYDASRINRLVLVSDGGANVGVTDAELIAEHAGSNNEDGVYMVGVGVGRAEAYNDRLMDTVTDIGKGASVFIPSKDEAWKVFNEQFVNTMAVAVRDVQVELSLPPGFAITKFSGEEYSSDPTEIEPQHLAPNDVMIFHQQIETCAPELVTTDAEIGVRVRYKDALSFEVRETEMTLTFGDAEEGASGNLLKGVAVFAYADALKAARDQGPEADELIAEALANLDMADAVLPEDPELAEMRGVLEAL